MRNNKGFTLIEVMVVLSVLAIIAILAYNFFGSTMREAEINRITTKYIRDLNAIAEAAELYYAENGSYPPNGTGAGVATWFANNTSMKTYPTLDPDWNTYGNDYEFLNGCYEDMGGPSTASGVCIYTNVDTHPDSKEVCERLNEYFGRPKAVWDYTANGDSCVGDGNSKGCCTDWGSGVNALDYYIMFSVTKE